VIAVELPRGIRRDRILISVVQLGSIDYQTGLRLQQRLVELRKQARVGHIVLLLEHLPVITLGRNAKSANIVASPELLAERHVEVWECDRGGDVTFHGPGQLVAYPIFDLRGMHSDRGEAKSVGAVEYVRRLEEVLIRTCADFGIPTRRIPGLTGVWAEPRGAGEKPSPVEVERSSSPPIEAKIAALGVHISRGVTSHGFALNVTADLEYFELIVPCGIRSRSVTSMEKELGRQLSLQEVAHAVSRNFGLVFHSQMLWLEDLDSLLRTSVGVPLRVPPELRRIRHEEEDPFSA
jgi:lipoyl(octanoyl) transferase